MSALWTPPELAGAFAVDATEPLSAAVGGVSIDTRTLQAGDLFFAIKGESRDGHDYVARAFEAGAAAAVVARERADSFAAFGPLFATDDTLKAMERLGVASRSRSKARIVAVTGSVGKTTAKEMLRAALSACGATHASSASYNNHWGVPLTLVAHARQRRIRGFRDRHESRRGDRAPCPNGASARGARDDDRAGSHRAPRLDRGDRRREGGDFPRAWSRAERRFSIATRRSSSVSPEAAVGRGLRIS